MKRCIFKITSIGAILCCLTLTNNLAIADVARAYQIELIIFSHMSEKSLTTEQWPILNPNTYSYTSAATLAPTTSDVKYYRLLTPQDFTLAKEQTRLNKFISTYHTVMHIAWRQQIFEPRYARPVHIEGGKIYNSSRNPTSQINGTIRISVQRYLNVSLDLIFAAPASAISKLARNDYFKRAPNNLIYFHLLQTRRMRSNELNYIDFPLYGILIKITPLVTPSKQA